MDYKTAGVDIEKGDQFVERIKKKVLSTYDNRVVAGVGGFSCLYDISPDKYLAAGTDGVGTKLKLAIELEKHDTIGIDLVAMCVNDILCTGAKPLFFMDYLATSSLNLEVSEQIINGIVEGCRQSQMALIGGETAEMPGMYEVGDYDLAGFCVGEVLKSKVINGEKVSNGDKIVAINSSGFHSNGYSLIRQLIKDESTDLKHKLLRPTKIYHDLVNSLHNNCMDSIHGIAHITGGGIDNINRINSSMNIELNGIPDYRSNDFKNNVCDSIAYIAKKSKLDDKQLYSTFNMGMGLVIITSDAAKVHELANELNYTSWDIGFVK
jgi:phosphoribosylformylglycinamidine cyclo-ligase